MIAVAEKAKDHRGDAQDAEKKLPAGWRWVRLGDVIAEAQAGFAAGERDANGLAQLRMNNVDTRGNLVWDEITRIPANRAAVSRYLLRTGDVLFNNTNSTALVGKSALFRERGEPVVYSNHFTRLRPCLESLDPQYLAHWLVGQWHAKVFAELCNQWIGQSAVKADKLLSLSIPLPPLSEQKRIAGLLSAQMVQVERARKALQEQLQAAAALPAACLREVFNGPQARAWPVRTLGDGLVGIEAGTSVLSLERPARGCEWGVLKVSAVSWGKFNAEENKAVPTTYTPKRHERVQEGDLLISRANTAELAGAVVFVRRTPEKLMLSDKTLRLVPKPDVYVPEFLEYAIRCRAAREFIEGNATGTSYSMRNISQETIRRIPILTPPLVDQRRMAAQLTRYVGQVEQLQLRCESQLAALDHLPAALLRRAFSGEL